MLRNLLLSLAILLVGALPVAAQEHDTHVALSHDLNAEFSQHVTLPSGLTFSARLGSQDGQHANIDFGGAGCMIDGQGCTAENVAAAAAALDTTRLVSVGGGVGYARTIDNTDLNLSATATWVRGAFTPGLELRVTRDDFWVGYVAWHHDISDGISKSLVEHDVQLGGAGVVRIGIGIEF